MNRFLAFLMALLILAAGASAGAQEISPPPEVWAWAADAEIPGLLRLDVWDGVPREHAHSALEDLRALDEQAPHLIPGARIVVDFAGNPPDEAVLKSLLITAEYAAKYAKELTSTESDLFKGGQVRFDLRAGVESLLSSDLADYAPGACLRGFELSCRWGEDTCTYAFAVRTDAGMGPS